MALFVLVFIITFVVGLNFGFEKSDWIQFSIFWILALTVGVTAVCWLLRLRHKHSELLCKELQNIVNSEIHFIWDNNILQLDIRQPNFQNIYTTKIHEPKRVLMHLEHEAYKELMDFKKRRDFYIKLHNLELREFELDLRSNIIHEIKLKNPNIVYDSLALFEIEKQIQHCYEKECHYSLSKSKESSDDGRFLYTIATNVNLLKVYDQQERDDICQRIEKAYSDAIQSPKFALLKVYFNEIKNNHTLFKDNVSILIDEVNSGGSLKGNCDLKICSNFWGSVLG